MSLSNIVTRHEGRLFLLLVLAASYLLDFITQSPEMQKHLFPYRADGNAGSPPQIVVRDLADDEDSPSSSIGKTMPFVSALGSPVLARLKAWRHSLRRESGQHGSLSLAIQGGRVMAHRQLPR